MDERGPKGDAAQKQPWQSHQAPSLMSVTMHMLAKYIRKLFLCEAHRNIA